MSAEQVWDAGLYDARHAFVWKYGEEVLDLLAPQPGERVMDVGCGTGHLTAQIAARGAEAVGLDNSPVMIEHARTHYPHLTFRHADARRFHLSRRFDAVFSNAVLHWVQPPEQAVACIHRALRTGGRFVAEFGGRGNIEAIVRGLYVAMRAAGHPDPQALNPWYYPSIGEYAALLEAQGFRVVHAELFDRPTPLEGGKAGLAGWLDQFAQPFLGALPVEQRCAVMRDTERRLRRRLYRDGAWHADYRRLRVAAVKE